MKRILSSPITALGVALCLRLFFVVWYRGTAGDSEIYEQIAANWLHHGKYAMDASTGGMLVVDLRMPGYPAFLAMVYAITRRSGEAARTFVMLAQTAVDLLSCLAIGGLAALLTVLGDVRAQAKRAFTAGLWLAALCPFIANYVAVPLTETWAIFFHTLLFGVLALVVTIGSDQLRGVSGANEAAKGYWALVALAGFVGGVGTLFRPETPLLLFASLLLLACWMLPRRQAKPWIGTAALMGAMCCVPLVPWAIRNAITFHEFQPLAPKDATLPGEVDPKGFMAWERTWLYRFRDVYLVPWKLNDEAINIDDIPANAFDTPEERDRVAAVLEQYNDELTWTAEEDEVFRQLAAERTARHPLRTYVWIPLRRAVRIWFTPRIELMQVSGHVFPLAQAWDEDRQDQSITVSFFLLNIAYLLLAGAGAWLLSRHRGARPALWFFASYLVLRTAFLTTLETPEPRYVLVCFPALLALGAMVFLRKPREAA